jgi:hypothetical protein
MTKDNNVGFGVASLVTSIVGFVGFIMPYIAIAFSICGIVFAVLQQKRYKTGLATGGLVLGILGVIGNLMWLGVVGIILAMGI